MAMNAGKFQLRRFESRLIEDRLAQIVWAEQAILTELGCPTDPVAIYAILNGEQAAPWPTRTAPRDKQRALHAMHAMLWVGQTRSHIAHDNARLAADAALTVGLLAGDAALRGALGARTLAKNSVAARARGLDIRAEATVQRAKIRKAVHEYRARHPDHSARTMARHLAVELDMNAHTIRRHLARKKTAQ